MLRRRQCSHWYVAECLERVYFGAGRVMQDSTHEISPNQIFTEGERISSKHGDRERGRRLTENKNISLAKLSFSPFSIKNRATRSSEILFANSKTPHAKPLHTYGRVYNVKFYFNPPSQLRLMGSFVSEILVNLVRVVYEFQNFTWNFLRQMQAGAEIELFSIERKIFPHERDVIVRGNAICWESPTTRRWINRTDTDCAVRQTKIVLFASMHRVDAKKVVKPFAFSAWRCRRRRTKNNLELGEKFHAFLMILENEYICAPNSSVIRRQTLTFQVEVLSDFLSSTHRTVVLTTRDML